MTEPLSAEEIQMSNDFVRNNFPNAKIIRDASGKYNNHAYAWHTDSKDNAVWLDKASIIFYWLDESYPLTTDPKIHSKISYKGYRNDGEMIEHSARKSTFSNNATHISKWGNGPLVEHAPADCPYWGVEGFLVKYE